MASCRQCCNNQVRADCLHKDPPVRKWPEDYHCFWEREEWDEPTSLCIKSTFTSDWQQRA